MCIFFVGLFEGGEMTHVGYGHCEGPSSMLGAYLRLRCHSFVLVSLAMPTMASYYYLDISITRSIKYSARGACHLRKFLACVSCWSTPVCHND